MADAAERLAIKRRKNDGEKKEAVALLSARCKDLGLTAMAKLLGVDAAKSLTQKPRRAKRLMANWIAARVTKAARVSARFS
jgi:hypothetical protein